MGKSKVIWSLPFLLRQCNGAPVLCAELQSVHRTLCALSFRALKQACITPLLSSEAVYYCQVFPGKSSVLFVNKWNFVRGNGTRAAVFRQGTESCCDGDCHDMQPETVLQCIVQNSSQKQRCRSVIKVSKVQKFNAWGSSLTDNLKMRLEHTILLVLLQ